MKIKEYKELVDYTMKRKKSDLVLKNANVLMLQTSEIIKADVAIKGKYIVGVGEYNGDIEIDCSGKFLAPGFVDSHLHFESTMANPNELVHYASMNGTTAFIADPHEAANVSGLRGIEYILEQTRFSTGDVFIMLPSCVPSKDSEDTGYIMNSDDMKKIIDNSRILGLGEVMDCKAVLDCKDSMMEKLELFEDKPKDGHVLGLNDLELSAYAMSGILTDHECSSYDEAIKKIRNGMYIHIREGSAAKNLKNIVEGIVSNDMDISRFNFCTDDKHIEDIQREGHISHNIRKSIELGMKAIDAYKIASYNPSLCYGLSDIGMIAPGKKANLVILNNLEKVEIVDVLFEGNIISKNYKQTTNNRKIEDKKIKNNNLENDKINSSNHINSDDLHRENIKKSANISEIIDDKFDDLMDTIHIGEFNKSMLAFKSENYAIELVDGELLTKKIKASSGKGHLNKVVDIERHHNTGKYHVAKVFGFAIKNGAIASSVSHDSHNVIVIGDNDRDIMIAIEKLKEIKGGYVLVENGSVYQFVPLPVMGLMSNLSSEEVNIRISDMTKKAHEMGVNENIEAFITLSFIALPVIPEIRITTNGLYDVIEDKYLD